jgi:hypothetical protein
MKMFRSSTNRHQAQAMVEFMLALPLLLLLIYGTIEVARLAFIFSSASNASRAAARYGAASGENSDGIPFYQDCEGIRNIVEQSAFINEFNEINITYDRGVDPDGTQIPISGVDPSPNHDSCPIDGIDVRNGDRIIVQVSTTYEPIVAIVPIEPLDIVSSSARTFIISIPILGSSVPLSFSAETSTPSRVPTSDRNTNTPTKVVAPTATSLPSNLTIVAGPPTNTLPPTITFTPSRTPLPSFTPSITPTFISCSGLTGVAHGPLIFEDNYMEMHIFNNTNHVLSTTEIYIEWNHDTGHAAVDDRTLRLRQVTLDSQGWDGDILSPSKYLQPYYPNIPTGESVIRFLFDKSYDVRDDTERIIIFLGTPGCTNYSIDSRQ